MSFLRMQSSRLVLRAWTMTLMLVVGAGVLHAQAAAPKFHVLGLAEKGGIHQPYVDAAKVWLKQEAERDHFSIDYIENTDPINDQFLSQYQLILQLNYAPYEWKPAAQAAFQRYIEEGKGGWIGFHHAGLLGDFDGVKMLPWFTTFMGGITYKDYIATFASAKVMVEDKKHPVMKGVPSMFEIENEEWYTWDKSPRSQVRVLATVDESSYTPDSKLKMGGDHPVVWTNEHYKARNLYIFMGHHPELFQNKAYCQLFRNSILWAAHQ